MEQFQRRVFDVRGNGGSVGRLCKHQSHPPIVHFAPLGTKDELWVKSDQCSQSMIAIRVRPELAKNHRNLALFNMAIGSKLRGCDLVRMRVVDVMACIKNPLGEHAPQRDDNK